MGKLTKALVMKKTLTSVIFLLITATCWAPLTDFRLRLDTLREASAQFDIKYHEAELNRFITDLGYRESGGNWLSINRVGCFGEWQFAESTLRYLGFRNITLKKFRENPMIFPKKLQEEALKSLIRVNLIYLKKYENYLGTTVRGIVVTRTGMIAASHLGGAGSLKRFLESGGRIDHKDSFGTPISEYLRKFNCYAID
jgi:hypothetical protein